MRRREFMGLCTAAVALPRGSHAGADGAKIKRFARARLVDDEGRPVRRSALEVEQPYIFHYPYRGTPCFLLRLDASLTPVPGLTTAQGDAYRWPGGVGEGADVVAYTAICPHQLSYPNQRYSVINYYPGDAPQRTNTITCCAHQSVFDPRAGGRVKEGPAPEPLATIVLEHDPDADELHALGTLGSERFEDFFSAYAGELRDAFGPGVARERVEGDAPVVTLGAYTGAPITC